MPSCKPVSGQPLRRVFAPRLRRLIRIYADLLETENVGDRHIHVDFGFFVFLCFFFFVFFLNCVDAVQKNVKVAIELC